MADVKIQLMKNGPLIISGAIEVVDAEGKPVVVAKQAFCRCGQSKIKPFCDGSHRACNFQG